MKTLFGKIATATSWGHLHFNVSSHLIHTTLFHSVSDLYSITSCCMDARLHHSHCLLEMILITAITVKGF